ncbi:uncharacterized protein LOC117106275 [Anneissia japonica]|uniref:uncharacterized protein LOC117106275 n=1 Tax=Anneissia japonica TaxID=1529436 RepID=UPI0014255F14|nr:uncharacterized protein LOC117106275 [Anneissia japonica]
MECVFILLMHGLLLVYAVTEPPPYQIDPMLLVNGVGAKASYPGGIDYLGIGYNLLYGNPDGSPATAAADPGLRPTWRVFDWTFNGGSTPDQVSFAPSSSCAKSQKLELFHNAYAYASKFENDVSFSAGVRFRYGSTKFSHSSYYKEVSASMQSNSYVYYEELDLCYRGEARYTYGLAQVDKYPLARAFVQRANVLPTTYAKENYDYMKFIHDFGTDLLVHRKIVFFLFLNLVYVTSRFKYSSSTSLGGSYMGFKSSINVNTDSVKTNMDTGFSAGLKVDDFTLGDDNFAMPYSYILMGMEEVFETEYWQLNDDYVSTGILSADFYGRLSTMRSNMELALADYPAWLDSDEAKEDPTVTVPITWAKGAFGLPKTNTGCPQTPGFTFHSGWRYHDSEDDDNGNRWSSPNHFVSGSLGGNMYQHFCMKTQDTVTRYDVDWPKGQYCVFHPSSGYCPTGMAEGSIYWDDEDDDNKNSYSGSLPRGSYGGNTKIYYCCKIDGFAENSIFLPTDSPFYLFPYTNVCQAVEGMNANMEYFRWDNEDDDNKDYDSGWHPYKNSGSDHNIYYCYYTPK